MGERAFRLEFISKIEHCATGAVYAQILDAIYPGTFPLSKITWSAKHEYEFVNNFKILQKGFDKNGITRHIEVAKLVKAKYQDNLEFMQWLKRYFDLNYNGEPYDAVGRRKGQELYLIGIGNKPVGSGPAPAPKKKFTKPTGGAEAPKKAFKAPTATAATVGGKAGASDKKVHELETEIAELKLTSDTLEKERDFYFGKLRDIEVLLQAYQEQSIPVVDLVLKILYATEDDKVEVDENGNLNIVNNADGANAEAPAEEDQVDMDADVAAEGEGEFAE